MNPDATDYWIGSGGGSTWNERAKLCGFTNNVCPEGYRIPTKAEFLEIKPINPISGAGSLSSILNIQEIKEYDSYNVAMRWTANNISNKTYLRIDALVVPKNFDENKLSSIDWSNENVVTRYFGANGFIHAFKHVNIVSQYTFPVARPMPGTEVHYDKLWQSNSAWTVLWNNIQDLSVNNEGYYWMFDEKMAFTFQDNTRIKTVRNYNINTGQQTGDYAFPDRKSVLGVLPVDAQDCCAIRCVKAENAQ